jgi:transposase
MWTPATRKNYSRNGLRYQSDVTDEEWRVIEPYLLPAKGIGRPRGWPLREIVNGIFYVMRSTPRLPARLFGAWLSLHQHVVDAAVLADALH